jgi:hypothetical protein
VSTDVLIIGVNLMTIGHLFLRITPGPTDDPADRKKENRNDIIPDDVLNVFPSRLCEGIIPVDL